MTMNDEQDDVESVEPYRFTTIDYSHPNPTCRVKGLVSVNFYDGHGIQRVAGVNIRVE